MVTECANRWVPWVWVFHLLNTIGKHGERESERAKTSILTGACAYFLYMRMYQGGKWESY